MSWIGLSNRLGNRITTDEVKESLDLLKKVGLLTTAKSGKLVRRKGEVRTTKNIPSESIQIYHKQMLNLAKKAMASQPVEERYFTGTTIGISCEKLPEAQELIAEFRQKFIKLMEVKPSEEIYFLSCQFFPTI